MSRRRKCRCFTCRRMILRDKRNFFYGCHHYQCMTCASTGRGHSRDGLMAKHDVGPLAVRHQTVLDLRSMDILHRVASQAIPFMQQPRPSLSNLIRYAIGLLSEEAKVWSDMGPLDQNEVKRLLIEARACRKKEEPQAG